MATVSTPFPSPSGALDILSDARRTALEAFQRAKAKRISQARVLQRQEDEIIDLQLRREVQSIFRELQETEENHLQAIAAHVPADKKLRRNNFHGVFETGQIVSGMDDYPDEPFDDVDDM